MEKEEVLLLTPMQLDALREIGNIGAGKTTLTEKLLLYAGMIRTAGMVRGRKTAKSVSSDWMEMEREISSHEPIAVAETDKG